MQSLKRAFIIKIEILVSIWLLTFFLDEKSNKKIKKRLSARTQADAAPAAFSGPRAFLKIIHSWGCLAQCA